MKKRVVSKKQSIRPRMYGTVFCKADEYISRRKELFGHSHKVFVFVNDKLILFLLKWRQSYSIICINAIKLRYIFSIGMKFLFTGRFFCKRGYEIVCF
jgi:hypothetical protein